MALNPKIWGPQYWFVLHTIALTYPLHPNSTVKKKYYDLMQNLPLFIPVKNMGNLFSELLDKYPVTPYLDSRESFVKWMYFIHNKLNIELNIPEIKFSDALKNYYKYYLPQEIIDREFIKKKQKYIFFGSFITLIIIATILCNK